MSETIQRGIAYVFVAALIGVHASILWALIDFLIEAARVEKQVNDAAEERIAAFIEGTEAGWHARGAHDDAVAFALAKARGET